MNKEQKKALDEAMKRVYGSNRKVNVKKVEEELDNIEKRQAEEPEEEVKEVKSPPAQPPPASTEEEALEGLIVSTSPHVKDPITLNKIMWCVVLALLPAVIIGVYFFGFKALSIILVSIITAIITEIIILRLTKKQFSINGSAVITGLLFALILPPTVPLWLPVIGVIFALVIGKHIFGGLGHNIFNPALAGRAFLVVSFPALMTRFILDGVTGATPLGLLKSGGITTSYQNLFFGSIGGCIGETSALALLIGALFLFFKKIIDWRIPATYLGTVIILALIFQQDPLFHILAGGLLIGAFFMATDYVTAPITKNGRLIFGFGCGFLTIILRLLSSYPEGVMFAILLMNAATPLIDRLTKPRPFGYPNKIQKKILTKKTQEQEKIKKKVSEMLKK